jgi:radical SAM superfamily enzyme YgiQ (UPF0313 family)
MMPGAKFQAYNLDRVIEDLKSARKRGAKYIQFIDDNPAMHPDIFKEFLKRIKLEGLDDISYAGTLSTQSAADLETTKLMRSINWDFAFVGVENIYKSNLDGMRKRSNEELSARAIDNLYESGITILAGIIVGNPDDTEETMRGNFQWFYERPIDVILPQYLTPYPGTATRKELLEEGLIVNKGGMGNEYGGWSTYNGEFAQCRTRTGLMPEEIEAIAYEELIRFNRSRIKRLLKGQLNFARNNPKHLFYHILYESIPIIHKTLSRKKLTPFEKAKQERERKRDVNRFNV